MVVSNAAVLRAVTELVVPGPSPTGSPAAASVAGGSSGTPVWLSIALALLTFAGVIASAFFLRRTGREARASAEESDRRGKREETMRTLRWAAELAVSKDDRQGRLGIAALDSLGASAWLESEDQDLISAVISSVTEPAAEAYREVGSPVVYEIVIDDPAAVVDTVHDRASEEGGGSG